MIEILENFACSNLSKSKFEVSCLPPSAVHITACKPHINPNHPFHLYRPHPSELLMSPLNIRSDTLSIFLHSALLRNDPVSAMVRKIMQKYGNNYLSVDDDSDDLNSDADDDSSSDSDSDDVLSTYERSIINRYVNSIQTTNHVDEDREYPIWEHRDRRANRFGFKFGNIYHSNNYHKFLQPSVRARIYEQSRNRSSMFRSLFRMPLSKIDYLTDMFISRGWVTYTHRCRESQKLFDRTQILIMMSLEHMGNWRPF